MTVTVYPALPDHDARRRFDDAAREARRLATHPSVLTIHDWGHAADGRPWVITDPQPAETMEVLLKADGPFPVEEALRIGVLVAGALETAHRAGIVHGDLSPARLVIGAQGVPLVADIGLAEFSTFPGLGALHNPIRYFAPPEVLEGTGVSAASDVYSLAATVYALLAGRAPHEKPPEITDSNASLLLRILQIEVPPIARPDDDIGGVESALRPALAHAAERRPLRVLDLAWSLQDVQRGLGLDVVEAVVLDLGTPRHPEAPSASADAPRLPPAAVPPEADDLPSWYTASPPSVPSTHETGLVDLDVVDEPPSHPSGRPPAGTGRHWATGLDHLGGPPAPTNGQRPNRHAPEPVTGALPDTPGPHHELRQPSRPESLNGHGNGLRPSPTAGNDDLGAVHQGRRPSRAPTPHKRRPPPASGAPEAGAFSVTRRTRSGSALDRARQARMARSAGSTPGEPGPDRPVAGPRLKDPPPSSDGTLALPVIVLIAVVVLLTIGVAYLVITGDGSSDPGQDQPGTSPPSAQSSFDEA